MIMKLHTTLISCALIAAMAADERPGNRRLRHLKVNKYRNDLCHDAIDGAMRTHRWWTVWLDGWSTSLETRRHFVASDEHELFSKMSHGHVNCGPVNGRAQSNISHLDSSSLYHH